MEELNHRSERYLQDEENLKSNIHKAYSQPQINFNSLDWFGVGGTGSKSYFDRTDEDQKLVLK